MDPLRKRPLCRVLLCWTLAMLMASSGALYAQPASDATAAAPAASDADLSFVVPGAVVVVVARPAQLLNSPAAIQFPVEVLQAAAMQESGLDPLAAEELVFSASPPMGGPPGYSLLATFAQPFKLKPSVTKGHVKATGPDGKPFLKSAAPDPMLPSLFRPAATKLLAGPEATLTPLLGGASGSAPMLADAARAAARGDDLYAIVDTATLRPLIGMGLMQAKLPPELSDLQKLPNLVKLLELRLNLSHSAMSELVLTANDEADAEQFVAVYNGVRDRVAAKVAEQSAALRASDDPVQQAAGRYSERMAKTWNDRMQLTQEGDKIVVLRGDLSLNEGNQLTYVATIGVLVGLLMPAVSASREAARRNTSLNNMKQIMLALLNHESARAMLPASASVDAEGKPLLSWRVHILPYMEQYELYKKFHLDEPWDSEHNKALIPLMPTTLLDPRSKLPAAAGKTNYLGVQGEKYFFSDPGPEGRKLRHFTDGLSNTIAIVQVDDASAVTWTKPDDWSPDKADHFRGLGGFGTSPIFAGYSDGSVQRVDGNLTRDAFEALLTINGGETTR